MDEDTTERFLLAIEHHTQSIDGIADSIDGLSKTIFEVFGSEKVGLALDQIALGPDYSVSTSLDSVSKAIMGGRVRSERR